MKFLCALIFACLSLQARIEPPAVATWSIDYNAHSTLAEYVAATTSADDDGYLGVLTAQPKKPSEGYWLDDPVDTAASIDEYNVGPVRPTRQAAMPMGINAAETVLHVYGDVHSTAAIPTPAVKPAEGDSFGTGMSFSIDRGLGFKVPDSIVHHVQAKDWW
jgi:hypothetical protein